MPELVLFVACEKVIISDQKQLSIIAVIQEITLDMPNHAELPANAAAPIDWYAVAQFDMSRDTQKWEQRFVLFDPEGSLALESPIAEIALDPPTQRFLTRFPIMPIAKLGRYSLKLLSRKKRTGEQEREPEWNETAAYAITVRLREQPENL